MPEDNFLDCMKVIAAVMERSGEQRPGEWYGKCLLGYPVQFCDPNARAVSIVYRITKTSVLTLSLSYQLRRGHWR